MNINVSLIGQMITFILLVAFTMKFVWPPLKRALDERMKNIADGLAAAQRGKEDLESAGKRTAEMMLVAKQQVQDTIAQADIRGAQIVNEAKGTAKTEGDRLVTAARAEIEQEVARAKDALREQVAALAVAGAEKILRREVDAKAHAELLDGIKKQL